MADSTTPWTPEGHVDFEKMFVGMTLEDLDGDGFISMEELFSDRRAAAIAWVS